MSYVSVAVPAAAGSLRLSAGSAALWRGPESQAIRLSLAPLVLSPPPLDKPPDQCKEFVHFLLFLFSNSCSVSVLLSPDRFSSGRG